MKIGVASPESVTIYFRSIKQRHTNFQTVSKEIVIPRFVYLYEEIIHEL